MMKTIRTERAQALPIVALLAVVLLGMIGMAIDVGRLYVARAELSRAVDAAALAGVLELPDNAAAEARADAYLKENLPGAQSSFPGNASNSLRVRGTRTVDLAFMGILGFKSMDVNASAAAGFGFVPNDSALILDATGSMGDAPCNSAQNNSGCPIKEAKDAADGFIDTLLGGGNQFAQVAFAPYRGCYNPPLNKANCVPSSMIVDFTRSEPTLRTGIGNTSATGGSGTNVCLGLDQALSMFKGATAQSGPDVVRSVVILTDGDNNYNAYSYGTGAPTANCRPNTDPSRSDPSGSCAGAQTRERELDRKTMAVVSELESIGVAVYVVAFGTCGTDDGTIAGDTWCSGVGNGDHDNTADRRLLKCAASSSAGTNDHYFEVPAATDLPAVFQKIARAIGFRLTE
jgi:Flp pilus assembly protein TadG